MLNKESLQIIQGMQEINNSAIISYPVSTISNKTKDILGKVYFDKLTDEFPEFGVWDLGSLLSSINILEEPTISLDGNILTAKDSYSKINYVTSSPSILGDSVCDAKIIDSTLAIESVVDVSMSTDIVSRIKKGAKAFSNLKDAQFSKVGDTFMVKTLNKESFNASSNSFELKLDSTKCVGNDFDIVIPISNFLSLPDIDFEFKVHEKNGQYRITMTNSIFAFVLSLKK